MMKIKILNKAASLLLIFAFASSCNTAQHDTDQKCKPGIGSGWRGSKEGTSKTLSSESKVWSMKVSPERYESHINDEPEFFW